jgi:hypothetical protein
MQSRASLCVNFCAVQKLSSSCVHCYYTNRGVIGDLVVVSSAVVASREVRDLHQCGRVEICLLHVAHVMAGDLAR